MRERGSRDESTAAAAAKAEAAPPELPAGPVVPTGIVLVLATETS